MSTQEEQSIPVVLQRITAFCGDATCNKCSDRCAKWVPKNPACCRVGHVNTHYHSRYEQFCASLRTSCRLRGWSIEEIVKAEYPPQKVIDILDRYYPRRAVSLLRRIQERIQLLESQGRISR